MPTPQVGLNPHAYDDKSGVPSTGSDAELHAVIVDMLKQGHSDDEVRKFVQKVDDLKDPTGARISGAMAGIGPGLLSGLVGLPMMVKDAVVDGVSLLQGKDPENAKAFVDSVKTFLPKLQAAGPREQAQMISELATSFGTGAATGAGTFAARKPLATGVGTTMLKAAEHPAGVRLAGGGVMIGGILHGNPVAAAGGAAGMMVPEAAEGMGRKLYKYGTGEEYVSPKQQAGLDKLSDKFKDAMANRNGTFADEQAAAALEAKKAATVEAAKTGLEPGVPSVRTSVSANRPDGLGKTSVSQSFKPPKAEADGVDTNPMIMGRRLNDYPPDVQAKYRSQGIGGPVQTAGPTAGTVVDAASPAGRPAIRVTDTNVAPAAGRKVVGSKAPKLAETEAGTDSLSELMDAMHGEDAMLPGNGSAGGAAVATAPSKAKVAGVPDTKEPVPTPRNLQMGNDIPTKEMVGDVRVRAQGGGGISIEGHRPGDVIRLTGKKAPLSEEAQGVLDQYLKENPDVDPDVAEAHLRNVMGKVE